MALNLSTKNCLVFVHIPKTAGTTFNFILSREYRLQDTIEVPSNVTDLEPVYLSSLPPRSAGA